MSAAIRAAEPARRIALVYARVALGGAFLSAVAARFGLWDHRPRPFAQFIAYTGEVLSFVPPSLIVSLAVASTVAETTLGLLLITGVRLRWAALASALLLAVFAVSMAISFGIKSSLDASVFSASAAASMLALRDGDDNRRRTAGSAGSEGGIGNGP